MFYQYVKLVTLEEVAEDRIPDPYTAKLKSTFSNRLVHPKERYRRSLLPGAIRFYDSSAYL